MLKIAAFVSGRGSNLKSVYSKVSKEKISLCAVISDNKDCPAVNFASQNNIPVFFVSNKPKEGFVVYPELISLLKGFSIDLILLAGFLKKISDEFVDAFENKIINIHPALLPSFGGKGMYGINVHKAVFDSSAKISGATVHFVDKIYDNGKIIAQKAVDISHVNNPEEIAEKVLEVEHELLPFVVEKFADYKIKIVNNRVLILD
jgi:formyltetrahydrofolate-dependent phosphoribosylglycinamide formyltransferase